jgi:hypothetical protein
VAERTAERAFVILAGLVGFLDGEGIGGVKDGVAIKKIYGAMEIEVVTSRRARPGLAKKTV